MPYRRVFERFICNDSAALLDRDGAEKSLIVKDLSLGGASVFGNYPLVINDRVTVLINALSFLNGLLVRMREWHGAKRWITMPGKRV